MAASVGIRVYKLTVHRRGELDPISLDSSELNIPTSRFLSEFAHNHRSIVQNGLLERSWYFEPREDNGQGNSIGVIHYGTFGFTSRLVDAETKETNYNRKVNDVEEIPLFYEFWCPNTADFALLTFQSFAGRSCKGIVTSKLREDFEGVNPLHRASIQQILPNDVRGSLYYGAPVRRLTLIRERAPSDVTDRYYRAESRTGIDFEVSLKARRNGSLGALADVTGMLSRDAGGVVLYDGIAFNQATAEIRIGKRTRRVGVFGSDSEAGLIDLTDAIVRGADGHPTFESIADQSDELLQNFFQVLGNAR